MPQDSEVVSEKLKADRIVSRVSREVYGAVKEILGQLTLGDAGLERIDRFLFDKFVDESIEEAMKSFENKFRNNSDRNLKHLVRQRLSKSKGDLWKM